jgi:serine/threonine protein kinase/Tfp pilus assembly protein PilF
MDDSLGQIGRFDLVSELGRGAMGVVYRGHDPHLGRDVAIKLLAPELASDEEMVARFTDEAKNASRLHHQNIATVFEAGPSPKGWYVAFELVEGQTLKALMSKGPLSIELATNYLMQTAAGLAVAHKGNVVHRDLKPENLIVNSDGIVKITDFGLAKRIGDPGRTRAGTILGTAYYMAPEQAKGLAVDARADWFSLGVIAYEMTTGKRPFDGYHEMAVLYAVVNDEPTPIDSLRPDAPPGLIAAIAQLMQKNPEQRLCDLDVLRQHVAPVTPSGLSSTAGTLTGAATVSAPEPVSEGPPVLAVLPLENRSPDPDFNYLAEGFTEDIGAALAECERFRVLSHEKVMSAQPESRSPSESGRSLGARYVLHGSLVSAGAKLKLRLRLLDLQEDRITWSQAFSGDKDDIFDFQESVASQVAQALTDGQSKVDVPARPRTQNSDAYDLYLKGRDYYRREGHENLEFAIKMFDKALEIDPKYANAHAALADAYAQMYLAYYDRDRKWLKKAETAAKTALMLDPDLPEAHRSLGRIMMEYGQNEDAIKEFETAISKRPDFHEAYRTLAWIYQGMRQYSDSIDWGQKSLRIKPMDRETYLLLGLNYLDLREWDKARHHFEQAIELSPDYGRAYIHLGNVKQKQGDFEEALALYKKAMKYLTDVNAYLDLGWAQLLLNRLGEARETYEQVIAQGSFEFVAFYNLGLIDELEGNAEKALGRYESAIAICRKQLANDPENPYCLVLMAESQARLGKHDEAKENAQRATAMESGNGAMTLELARVRAITGDSGGALLAIASALNQPMGPSSAEVKADPHFKDLDLSQVLAD